MHRVLKSTGSIYLHIDHTAHAYAKAMMDAIFGRANFRNEIVWCYTGPSNTKRWFPRKHDTILWYVKGNTWVFNAADMKVPYVKLETGNTSGIFKQAATLDAKGKVVEDWWSGFTPVGRIASERTGYPTQKPLALYERIIKASSNEGDIVLDPFAGCATTCVAAERLGRKWIGIDLNKPARQVILTRLQNETTKSMAWGKVVKTPTKPPERTDNREQAAPELTLTSPKPRAPKLTARQLRERLIIMDGKKCQGCGWKPHHEEYLEVDHMVPKSRDGRDDIRNRVLLCSPCNGAKGNRLTLAELREKRIKEGRMADKSWNRAWYERTGRFA